MSARAGRERPVWSIRWIVTGAAVLLATLPVLAVGYVSERHARDVLAREIETRLLLAARNLANASHSALLGDFPELTLQPLIHNMLAEQPEISFAVVLDHVGRVRGHPDARRLDTPFQPPRGLAAIAPERRLGGGEMLRANAAVILAQAPVREPSGRVIGTALIGLERRYVLGTLAASRRQQGILLATLALLGVCGAFVSMSYLLRPVAALRAGLERIGRGDFETPIAVKDPTELGKLATLMNDVARDLQTAQRQMIERERLAHEIELAREIQRSLLPRSAWRDGSVEILGEQRAAAEVGGDYYDILPLQDGRIAVAIADVSGKGLGGCLVMAMLSALLRTLRHVHHSPSALLASLDERLAESLRPGVFVTMFYGILDPGAGRLVWASAGHNPALVYRRHHGAVERSASRGIPLGAVRGGAIRRTLQDQTLQLEPGDLLVQYTDAYTEAFSPEGEAFGIDRLEQTVAAEGDRGAESVARALAEVLERWTAGAPPGDDQTVLILGRNPAALPVTSLDARDAIGEAMGRLTEAEHRGCHLRLTSDLRTLASAIRSWATTLPCWEGLGREAQELLGSALYEACANVAEHGYAEDPGRDFDVWWVPPDAETRGVGYFLIRDDGLPFRPEGWKATDFREPGPWRRGRGLGLDIIHGAMERVIYQPGTPRGNLTTLALAPARAEGASEAA